jgi:hypothetical protein
MKSNEHLGSIWSTINQKCNNPNNSDFEYYGGKGIILCEEWDNYNTFKEWATNNGYKDNLVLSRKDTEGDYCPENCEWITDSLHRQKRRKYEAMVEYNGNIISIYELGNIVNINVKTIISRYLAGCRGMDLVRVPNKSIKVAV